MTGRQRRQFSSAMKPAESAGRLTSTAEVVLTRCVMARGLEWTSVGGLAWASGWEARKPPGPPRRDSALFLRNHLLHGAFCEQGSGRLLRNSADTAHTAAHWDSAHSTE